MTGKLSNILIHENAARSHLRLCYCARIIQVASTATRRINFFHFTARGVRGQNFHRVSSAWRADKCETTAQNRVADLGRPFLILRYGRCPGWNFYYHLRDARSNPMTPSGRWTTHDHDETMHRPRGSTLKLSAMELPWMYLRHVHLARGFARASQADQICKMPPVFSPVSQY